MSTISDRIITDLENIVHSIRTSGNNNTTIKKEHLLAINNILTASNIQNNPVLRKDLIVKIADKSELVAIIHAADIALQGEDANLRRVDQMLNTPPLLRDFLESMPKHPVLNALVSQCYTEYSSLPETVKTELANLFNFAKNEYSNQTTTVLSKILSEQSNLSDDMKNAISIACINASKLAIEEVFMNNSMKLGLFGLGLTCYKLTNPQPEPTLINGQLIVRRYQRRLEPDEIKNIAKNYPFLTEFHIEDTTITSLEGINNIKNLKRLELRSNQLTEIPKEIFQLGNLQCLAIESNAISTIPSNIENLKKLTTLGFTENQLVSISPEISKLSSLENLYLNDNQIGQLPDEICKLKNLKNLNLNYNELTSLPNQISELKELTYLGVGGNQLKTLPSSIGNLTKLSEFDLSDNPFQKLPSEIKNLSLTLNDFLNYVEWDSDADVENFIDLYSSLSHIKDR